MVAAYELSSYAGRESHALEITDFGTMDGLKRWLGCTQQKGTGEPDVFQRSSFDKGLKSFYVNGDIGVFRHAYP